MRKTSKVVAQAFINGERKAMGNTMTDGTTLYLHGNAIAKRENGRIYATLAGWPTVTTRERLNTLFQLMASGVYVCQRKGETQWHNLPMGSVQSDSDSWVNIDADTVAA